MQGSEGHAKSTPRPVRLWFEVPEVKRLDRKLKALMMAVGNRKTPWPLAREAIERATRALDLP